MYSRTTGQSTVHAPPVSMKTMYLGQASGKASVVVPPPPSPLRRFLPEQGHALLSIYIIWTCFGIIQSVYRIRLIKFIATQTIWHGEYWMEYLVSLWCSRHLIVVAAIAAWLFFTWPGEWHCLYTPHGLWGGGGHLLLSNQCIVYSERPYYLCS